MKTIQIAVTAANNVTPTTLASGPVRMLTFLQAISERSIRAKFVSLGWSDELANEAWDLLGELRLSSVNFDAPKPDATAEAMAACETWQNTGLVRARAMLQLRFPDQAAFMFHDFAAGRGTAAVLDVSTFIARRQVLENGAERKATRKVDHEALVVLAEAGVTHEVITHLEGLVESAQKVGAPPAEHLDQAEIKRQVTLRKIHAWLTAWSEMARTVITRRDHLIRLGIAKRRARKATAAVVERAAPPATPAPPPVETLTSHIADEPAPDSRAA